MDTEEKLRKAYNESKEYLESTSALELMGKSALFKQDLEKLVKSQKLPAVILIGCLMDEVHKLNAEPDAVLLDCRLTQAFDIVMKSADKKFMKKEQL